MILLQLQEGLDKFVNQRPVDIPPEDLRRMRDDFTGFYRQKIKELHPDLFDDVEAKRDALVPGSLSHDQLLDASRLAVDLTRRFVWEKNYIALGPKGEDSSTAFRLSTTRPFFATRALLYSIDPREPATFKESDLAESAYITALRLLTKG